MKLTVLEGEFAVARLNPTDAIPPWATRGSFSSVTRTAEEASVVCAAAGLPANVQAEHGWRCLRVAGRLDFSLTGVLASIANPLAAAGLSIFVVSTYDTDYVLVREASLGLALENLRCAGHEIEQK
jgi:hypothetical protein